TVPGQPELLLRPDITLRGEYRLAVVDVKWKRLAEAPEPSDLHQILAYAAASQAGLAALVYPGKTDRAWVYPKRDSQAKIALARLRICGSPEQCERSLRRLARTLTDGPA